MLDTVFAFYSISAGRKHRSYFLKVCDLRFCVTVLHKQSERRWEQASPGWEVPFLLWMEMRELIRINGHTAARNAYVCIGCSSVQHHKSSQYNFIFRDFKTISVRISSTVQYLPFSPGDVWKYRLSWTRPTVLLPALHLESSTVGHPALCMYSPRHARLLAGAAEYKLYEYSS